jgi:hypothetical protein
MSLHTLVQWNDMLNYYEGCGRNTSYTQDSHNIGSASITEVMLHP